MRGGVTKLKIQDTIPKIIIVSIWGRGAWLAQQLSQVKGCEVKVLDLSSVFPLSSIEREGPFGVFVPEELGDLEKQYLCGDNYYKVPQGVCVMTQRGPVEFRGLLSNVIKPNTFLPACEKVFSVFKSQGKGCKSSANSYLLSPVVFRELSARFFQNIHRQWEECCIKKEHASQITAIDFNKDTVSVKTDKGQNTANILVLTLSALELAQCTKEGNESSCLKMLFSQKWQVPQYIWRRFALSWKPGLFKQVIPPWILVLPECVLPHTSTKTQSVTGSVGVDSSKDYDTQKELVMSIKSHPMEEGKADVWVLCPYIATQSSAPPATIPHNELKGEVAKQATFFKALKNRTQQVLEQLFPPFDCVLEEVPEKAQNKYFIQYEKNDMSHYLKKQELVCYLNPEAVASLSTYDLFQKEQALKSKILQKLANLTKKKG